MIYRLFPLFVFRRLPLSALWVCLFACFSCNTDKKVTAEPAETFTNSHAGPIPIKYANGFDVKKENGYYVLHIRKNIADTVGQSSYMLLRRGIALPPNTTAHNIIRIPVNHVVLLQTAYTAFFDFCEATATITGIADSKYIFSAKVNQRIKAGMITETGSPEQLNTELITKMNPDMVIGAGYPNLPNKNAAQLEQLGIPVLLLTDWLETNPLGRTEWVKLIGFLTGKDSLAIEKFKIVEDNYEHLRKKAVLTKVKPLVICNLPYRGTWYMPGGDSYISHLLRDAHGSYNWFHDKHSGGIQVDFERVFLTGLEADVWINPGSALSLADITSVDPRLANFRPLKTGRVYNNNKRTTSTGANDYWESGLVHPDILLADIMTILHPGILPEHELFYYQKLD